MRSRLAPLRDTEQRGIPLNKAHYERFVSEVRRQVDRLGLQSYDVTIRHTRLDRGEWSNITSSEDGRAVLITYNSAIEQPDPEKVARHEVAHLLLSHFQYLAESRYTRQEAIDMEVERICTVLEKVL